MSEIRYTSNPFGGVVTDPNGLPATPAEFEGQLERSLVEWTTEGYKVVWLEVPLSNAALVPVAAEAGFDFHHADANYVLMTRRLIEDAHIPPYASHYIGAGGVVLNSADEILVVSERHRRNTRVPSYKLPGGALHPGEHLVEGVVREVLEETGVNAKFESLVCFRHWHGYRYNKSDIYFVCRLSPLSTEITMQTEEIEDCLWMPVQEYLQAEDTSNFNKQIVGAALNSPGIRPYTMEGYGDPSRYEFFMPFETV